jgi:protein TonB
MPRDLFGDIASRPRSVRSRRAPVVSLVVHTLLVVAVVVFSLVKSDALPMPREMLSFYAPAPMIDVPLPPPPPPAHVERIVDPSRPAVSPDAAPVVAPSGITAENPLEELLARERSLGVAGGFADASSLLSGSGTSTLEQPPPPRPPPAPPVRLHSGIRAPLKVTHVAPVYPPIAMAAKVEGIVILEATVDTQGSIAALTVLKSIPLLDQAAIEAVRQWKFTSALLNGVPVPVIMTVTVRFTLQ